VTDPSPNKNAHPSLMCGRCGGARRAGRLGRLKREHLLDGLTCHAEFAGDIRLGPSVFDESCMRSRRSTANLRACRVCSMACARTSLMRSILSATSSPWLGAVFCLLIVSVMARVYRAVRWAPIAAAGLDPLRRFSGVDHAALSRAGARCERHGLLFGRCRETAKLHADHVHPHSKGGSTTVANGHLLCSRHNKQNAARIPFNWELRRVEKQRVSYFPAGASGAVVRRASRRAADGR